MKIIDNFDLISKHLSFNNADEFYFLQILKRGKDGHQGSEMNKNNKSRLVKYYTVTSLEYFEKIKSEVKAICDAVNARAYIHPTKRNAFEVSKAFLKDVIEDYTFGDWFGLKENFSTACGKSFINSDKKYIVDLDGEDVENITQIIQFIDTECEPLNTEKILYQVPTKNGIHLITKPFNVAKFSSYYSKINIHKNNPTLLYYKSLE